MNHRHFAEPRRSTVILSQLETNISFVCNPWVVAFWSAAFPGFGYLRLGQYVKGFFLITWEIIINFNAGINEAMVYSFTGRFEMAKQVLDSRWLLLYLAVYIHSVWCSYRLAIECNRQWLLADREKGPIRPFVMGSMSTNFLDKRTPFCAAVFSMFMPGLGHFYLHRTLSGAFLMCWTIIITYMSRLLEGIQLTFLGQFHQAMAVIQPEWMMFLPSIYLFAVHEAYFLTVEYNKAYKTEQACFLQKTYQSGQLRIYSKSFDNR